MLFLSVFVYICTLYVCMSTFRTGGSICSVSVSVLSNVDLDRLEKMKLSDLVKSLGGI